MRTRVVVIGDSHAKVFAHKSLAAAFPQLEFVLATVAGATVSGLENPNSGTRALSTFQDRIAKAGADHAVVMLGEVDTGFVIWWRAQKHGATVEEMLQRALGNYQRFLGDLAARMNVICISTPLPTIRDGEALGDVANARSEVTASQAERTELTLRFNRAMERFCGEHGIGYLDLDPLSLGAQGVVKAELLNPDQADHHYHPEAFAGLLAHGLGALAATDPVRYHIYMTPAPRAGSQSKRMNTAELAQPPSRGTAAPAKGDELTEEEKIRSKENKLARRYEAAGAFFLSFPKSGRTWVRTVVAHYLSQRYGVPFDIEFEADDPRWLRPCFTHNYFDVYRYTPGEPVLLEEERLLAAPLVMLVRDPRDVCASYYHHIKLRDGKWSGHAYEFARDEVYGIERQARFVELLLQFYRRHAGPKVLVRYEDLRKHPLRGFRQLLAMVDRGGVDDAALRTAIELSSFDRMQEEEKKTLLTGVSAAGQARLGITDWNEDDNALKVRKGKVGGYLSEFGLRHAIALSLLPATRRLVLKMKLLPWSAT